MVSVVQQTLSAASDIPSDVKFIFEKEEDGEMTVKEVRAHKFILALVSDVFRNGFYGGMPDDGSIKIEDVTKESFEAMIDFIYEKKADVSIYDWDVLCSLYYLGDKYNIKILMRESLKAIHSKEITIENVLNVGQLADQNTVHEELAETLYEAAALGLSKMFGGEVDKVQEFFNELDTTEAPISSSSLRSLVKIMARVRKQTVCENCKAAPCLNGREVTPENCVPGAVILHASGKSSRFVGRLHRRYIGPVPFSLQDLVLVTGAGTGYVFQCKKTEM